MGILYQENLEFTQAYNNFKAAVETVEGLRREIVSGEESKTKHGEEWNNLYRRMVSVCLQLNKKREAIEYIEGSKTRNLAELLLQNNNSVDNVSESSIVYTHIRYQDIQNILDSKTVIIQWYIFSECFRTFIITSDRDEPIIWDETKSDLDNLNEWTVNKYLKTYISDKRRWVYELSDRLDELARILHIDSILSLITNEYNRIVLIPHLYLHLLPIHALPVSSGGNLMDKFPRGVSYAPSCKLLQLTQSQVDTFNEPTEIENHSLSLFAIQNPTSDLGFADIEVETLAKQFAPRHILKREEATKAHLTETENGDRLSHASWIHFSGHGYFDFNNPLQSCLKLADSNISPIPENKPRLYLKISPNAIVDLDKCFTLRDVLKLRLSHCRIVTLSACETGLVDYRNITDEYIGLSSGFIVAGSAFVVSSLWRVDDFSTALLMIKFYENIMSCNYDITLALNSAQKWFREITQKDLLLWISNQRNIDDSLPFAI